MLIVSLMRPVLGGVKDAQDVNCIAANLVDDDVRKGSHHQFARSLLLSYTATVWETLQIGGRVEE